MAVPMNPVVWSGTSTLEHTSLDEYIKSRKKNLTFQESLQSNSSFLYSATVLRKSIEKSRTAFLNLSLAAAEPEEQTNVETKEVKEEDHEDKPRKASSKRISYKIKRSSSVYRKPTATRAPIRGTTVAELASKFDKMIAEKKSILEDRKFAKLVRRVNSQKGSSGDSIKLTKKPSVKMKSSCIRDEKPVFVTKRPSVVRKVSIKKVQKTFSVDKTCVRAKISQLENPKNVAESTDETDSKEVKITKPTRPNSINVKEKIERFEKCNNNDTPKDTLTVPKEKPKVPEKRFSAETIDLLTKNSTLKFKTKPTENQSENQWKTNLAKIPVNPITIKSKTKLILVASNHNTQKVENKAEPIEDQPDEKKAEIFDRVPVINIPTGKQKRCESAYEILNLRKRDDNMKISHSESNLSEISDFKPNPSFLWRQSDRFPANTELTMEEDGYDVVIPPPDEPIKKVQPPVPPKPSSMNANIKRVKPKMPEPRNQEKDYEDLNHREETIHSYEDIEQREDDGYDGYEAVNPMINRKENIYEVLPCHGHSPPPLPIRQEELLPPPLPSKNSYYTVHNQEIIFNGYESIGSAVRVRVTCDENESSYETLGQRGWGSASNRDSVVSSDQQSNSLYGRSIPSWTEDMLNYKATSVSSSDRSDEWEDLPDEEEKIEPGFIIIKEKPKISKKTSEWTQQLREQWSKRNSVDRDDAGSYHHYESVRNGQSNESHYDSDSFDSDSDYYDNKPNMHDSGVDMGNTQLPDPPNNQAYVLTRLASAGKRMKRLLTKNDITKTLNRMTKRKSRTDLNNLEKSNKEEKSPSLNRHSTSSQETGPYQNIQYARNSTSSTENSESIYEKQKNKKGFLTKFRRSMSLSAETAQELTQELTGKPKSTFYLTEINIDDEDCDKKRNSVSPTPAKSKYARSNLVRPQVPPPPLPNSQIELRQPHENDPKRTTSWYAECGVFNDMPKPNGQTRPNTSWYAEVGLYQSGPTSTPSTSSAENSGNNTNGKSDYNSSLIFTNSEEYYNLKNENTYYNDSIGSITSNDSKTEKNYSLLSGEMQQLLQDEPLYQLYDAALSESYCKGETLDLDYEEVNNDSIQEVQLRPSAMELILKNGNSVSITRTLWCEIPEVKQSPVLSTLSLPQKKLQEAKFEMMTSEASYLNSLNVLTNHFMKNLSKAECLTDIEKEILFGKIPAVKVCSEKLLQDIEKCWQQNILLNNICDIIQQHSEENFNVYVNYCESQILFGSTLKKLREKSLFNETLHQLEASKTCQALKLDSFLMLPMQRITRWPLLLDAVLKRLSVNDKEYITCQQALATINKIVKQCNEAARSKERETEMLALKNKIDFGKCKSISLLSDNRYLVKSGPVTQMVSRGDDVKLTFGKRFQKVPLFLFLFNDLLLVTKYRSSEDTYFVLHYCPRSFVDVNVDGPPANLGIKDSQRHLIFLTLLENQDEKVIEMLLSCNEDSDKERWLRVLSPVVSQDPDETLYERWDCPQVTAIHDYFATQPDELLLSRGDIIYVNRKMADGWYHGEKIRDGECGWFPSNYVQEIANPHVRARNLRQRYRLLAFSANYMKNKGQNEL